MRSLSLFVALTSAASLAAQTTSGSFRTNGSGCPNLGNGGAFYEQFTGLGTGDLTATGLYFSAANGGWNVLPGGMFEASFGANQLALGDDSIADVALPFAFPIPGYGAFATLQVDSNGRLGVLSRSDLSESPSELLNGPDAAFCLWWDDLNPSSSGAVHVDTFTGNPPGQNRVVITWDQVPQFSNSDANTFQAQLFDNGDMIWWWQAGCADDAIVGLSTGNGVADPGPIDLTAAAPFALVGLGNAYSMSLAQTPGSGPPNIGNNSFSIDVLGIDPSAPAGAMNIGLSPAALDLTPFGAPGCTLYSSVDLGLPLNTTTAPAVFNLALPNLPGLVGATLYTQAIAVVPGANALNIAASDQGVVDIGRLGLVIFEADGSNSFNSDTSQGYFRITNNSGVDIASVRIDASPIAGLSFDTDQTGLADRFDGGDGSSATAGCANTFRNASDLTTGLVYANTPASPCSGDPLGWVGSNAGSIANDWLTLDFTFTDFNHGEVFAFDADTDGGPGIGGDDMAGMTLTVTLVDGRTLSGALTAVRADYGRADL